MWFIYALLGAVGKSYSGFFRKKIAKSVSSAMYIWVAYSLILIVFTPFMFSRFPELKRAVLELPIIVLGVVLSNLLATKLNMEALKREELSYTAPLNAMVPLFTLLIAGVFLNESPPRFGVIGVLAIVAGAYIVSIKPGRIHWYDPIKRLATSAGAQLSIAVTLFYAINTVLIKVMTNDGFGSLTIFYLTTLIGWLFLIYVPILKHKELKAIERSDKLAILGGGISSFASGYFHILATASTFTSYATSVRRLDALISILLGWRYLKETNIRIKLIGAGVMTSGTILLAVS
ncbi:MAG: EamA/RhaT family transporter [Candidatus Saccharibacteria bacterium]|nr:EamA/RhaT family transporter [Candidatus Saccharibacteria bacterium]MDB5181379.1 EamA/RhaT family transporter [Candidatus Saccharibacteria bacterium]